MIFNYADWNDVDEDLMTVSSQGGEWFDNTYCGVMFRDLSDVPGNYFRGAASRSPKVILIIRMIMMSTKTCAPSCFKVECGTRTTTQVSHVDIWAIRLLPHGILLLRPTSEIDQILYGFS